MSNLLVTYRGKITLLLKISLLRLADWFLSNFSGPFILEGSNYDGQGEIGSALPDPPVLAPAFDDRPAVLAQLEGDVVGLEAGDSVDLVDVVVVVLRQELDATLVGVSVSGLKRSSFIPVTNKKLTPCWLSPHARFSWAS